MDQKTLFNDALASLVEHATEQGNKLTKNEIKNYFRELITEQSQYEFIYSYLTSSKISVEGYEAPSESLFSKKGISDDGKRKTSSHTVNVSLDEVVSPVKESEEELSFIRMYMKELESISPASDNEKKTLIQQLLNGNTAVTNRLVELYLGTVATMAEQQRGKGVTFGDLIQEGNMGLILAVSQYVGQQDDFDQYIETSVKNTLEEAVNAQVSSDRIGQRLVGKLNQLDYVTKNLNEKLGRVPQIPELASEMNISEDEVSRLLKISLDTLSVNEDTKITGEIPTPEAAEDPLTWRINNK